MKHKNNPSKAPEPAKVFDVRRPGRASVSATSRPVIVGHKPQVQDPMMSHDSDDARPLLDAAHKVTVQPTTAPAVPADEFVEITQTPAAQSPDTNNQTQEVEKSEKSQAPLSAPAVPEVPTTSEVPTFGSPEPDADAAADLAVVALKDTAEMSGPPVPETPLSTPDPAPSQPSAIPPTSNDNYFEFPIDEPAPSVVASTEPLPELPKEPVPSTKPHIYVSHHHPRSIGRTVWTVIVLLVVLLAACDVLLDAGFIVINNVPHTTFFQ